MVGHGEGRLILSARLHQHWLHLTSGESNPANPCVRDTVNSNNDALKPAVKLTRTKQWWQLVLQFRNKHLVVKATPVKTAARAAAAAAAAAAHLML
jgi:hypothetical protein